MVTAGRDPPRRLSAGGKDPFRIDLAVLHPVPLLEEVGADGGEVVETGPRLPPVAVRAAGIAPGVPRPVDHGDRPFVPALAAPPHALA